jgi:uncharacterized damage-inducible protein DinB
MEIIEYLRRQFTYDSWANSEVLAGLKNEAPLPPLVRPLQLLAHIVAAERLWFERIQRQPQSLAVWPNFTLAQCEEQIVKLAQLWDDFLTQLSPGTLTNQVPYTNSKGESWTNTVQDILTHVLFHSAYHRGQIAILVRASGHTPAYTDFIHPVRQGLIE